MKNHREDAHRAVTVRSELLNGVRHCTLWRRASSGQRSARLICWPKSRTCARATTRWIAGPHAQPGFPPGNRRSQHCGSGWARAPDRQTGQPHEADCFSVSVSPRVDGGRMQPVAARYAPDSFRRHACPACRGSRSLVGTSRHARPAGQGAGAHNGGLRHITASSFLLATQG